MVNNKIDAHIIEPEIVDIKYHINPKDNIKVAAFIDAFVDNYSDLVSDKQAGLLKVAAKILASVHYKD